MLDFDHRAMLLLGVLKTESSHGYVVHDFVDKNLGRVANLKKPTAYATLDKLLEMALVEVRTEQVGNRPQRKVYSITTAGLAHLDTLLRASIAGNDDLRGQHDVAVMFLQQLPPSVVRAGLHARLVARREEIALYEHRGPRHLGLGVALAVDHMLMLARADVAWLEHALVALGEDAMCAADADAVDDADADDGDDDGDDDDDAVDEDDN
jgi:DNA-binding PadR family transcriptional regulator